ncbi:MAG: hypothetical protein ACLR23_05550 [Clostridia bacterium]
MMQTFRRYVRSHYPPVLLSRVDMLNVHLQLALVKKDKGRSLSILQKMLPAMKKEWNTQDYQLYRNVNGSDSTFFSSKLAKNHR